jgi:hypothetical protein
MVYFSLGVIICGKTVTGISSMDLCVFCVILEIVTNLCCFVSAHLGILSLCYFREVQRYLYLPASYHCPLFWDLRPHPRRIVGVKFLSTFTGLQSYGLLCAAYVQMIIT